MEDVLEVYHRPRHPQRPLVCFDEKLTKETRLALPTRPGDVAKFDYEYERNGTVNLFMFFAPLEAWRHVKVTERRTMVDFAECMRELVDVHFPEAEKIVLVMDNLNTHKLASLYEAFEPAEARRIIEKLEIHYTPKHGSWLNMRAGPEGWNFAPLRCAVLPKTAEIELSVLSRQCLKVRIPDHPSLANTLTAWEDHRNANDATVHWRFTTDDARIKLHSLYPSVDVC